MEGDKTRRLSGLQSGADTLVEQRTVREGYAAGDSVERTGCCNEASLVL